MPHPANSPLPLLLVLIGAFLALGGGVHVPAPPPAPGTIVPAPSAELQAAVAPVTAALKGHADEAAKLAAWFRDAALVIAPNAKSSAQVRQALILGGQALFAGGLKGKVPGGAEAVDAVLLKYADTQPYDAAKTAAALNAISWACSQA